MTNTKELDTKKIAAGNPKVNLQKANEVAAIRAKLAALGVVQESKYRLDHPLNSRRGARAITSARTR